MDDSHRRSTVRESLENLRQPMPLRRKLYLILRNYWLKLRNHWIRLSVRSSCCGHYGEPGC